MKKALNAKFIQEKSKELRIPYQRLLTGCSKEWVIDQLLSHLSFPPIYIRRCFQLGIEAYKRESIRQLNVCIKAKDLTVEQLKDLLLLCFEDDMFTITQESKKNFKVMVGVPFDTFLVPITLFIDVIEERKAQKVLHSLHLLYEEDRTIEMQCYYPEVELAEAFLCCFERMELMTDMAILDMIYCYATSGKFSGRHLLTNLDYLLKEQGLTLTIESLDLLYQSMESKKIASRFKGYLHNQKRTKPSYQQVWTMFKQIYQPICEAMIRDEIFLGDWMPEVGRYL